MHILYAVAYLLAGPESVLVGMLLLGFGGMPNHLGEHSEAFMPLAMHLLVAGLGDARCCALEGVRLTFGFCILWIVTTLLWNTM